MDTLPLLKMHDMEDFKIVKDEPMSGHTSFRTGGPADYFVDASQEELWQILSFFKKEGIPVYVVGNGSNILVGDGGFRGAVVHIGSRMSDINVEGTTITVEAGAGLFKVADTACSNGLSGLEFAAGIPGSIGGAVFMNAGAYGGEMADIITSVRVMDRQTGEIIEFSGSDCDFGYRHSRFQTEDFIILSATFALTKGESIDIKTAMNDLKAKRAEKQPIEYPSAGSTFKRPEGYFAGKLVSDAGLKGETIGGAQVSEKHGGFIINIGGATSSDIKSLMDLVEDRVFDCFGVRLEPEVRLIGEF